MPKKPDVALYLHDLVDAINQITAYTRDITWEEFLADRKTQDAVIRNFEIIG